MPDGRTRLTLELELAADPIAGIVRDSRGQGEPFSGWMALTRAIELSLSAAQHAASPKPDAVPDAAAPELGR